MENKQAGKG